MVSKSIIIHGGKVCSGACAYCSAAKSQNYTQPFLYLEKDKWLPFLKHVEEENYKTYKADWEAFRKTWDNDKMVIAEVNEAKKQHRKPEAYFDLWFFNPLSAFKVVKEVWENVTKILPEWNLHWSTSDNGVGLLGINDDPLEKVKWLKDHDFGLQLSHDGIGEWLRLPIDPLQEEPYKSVWMEALRLGVWNSTNCTLSFYNYSFFKNLDYFNKIFDKYPNIKMYCKLNHCYDSTYNIQTINKEGRWQDTIIEELKGKPIGHWELHNGSNEWDKHILDDYIQEWFHLAILCQDPIFENDKRFKYVRTYMNDQWNRMKYLKSHDDKSGACRAFQRYKYGIGDSSGWSDQTFVLDTMGGYSECNLIDNDYSVENPGGVQPDYCKGCRFELASECNGCGSMPFPEKCEYLYRWESILEIADWVRGYKSNCVKAEQNRIWNNIIGMHKCQNGNC
jgi:hypothetical protein